MGIKEKTKIMEQAVELGLNKLKKPLALIRAGEIETISPMSWYMMLSMIKYYLILKHDCVIETSWTSSASSNEDDNSLNLRWQVMVNIFNKDKCVENENTHFSEFKALQSGVKAALNLLLDAQE